MKKHYPFLALIFVVFLLLVSGTAFAQDSPGDNFVRETRDQGIRQNFLRELGLNREQIQQIRLLNSKRAPLMQEAQKNVREANRNLDQAIYSDSIDENLIQLRLQEVQKAQGEVFKIRAMSEFEVRKILTPEQLTKFRELRDRFANRVKNTQQRIRTQEQESSPRQTRKSDKTRPTN